MLDTLSLGVRAALLSTLIPKLTVSGEGDEMEIEISDNPHDSTKVEAANAPIIVTLTQVGRLWEVKNRMITTVLMWTSQSLIIKLV